MNTKIPTSIAITIIFILVIAAGVGMWRYGQKNQPLILDQPPIQKNQKSNSISSWQTYQNEQQGFEIKLPTLSADKWKEDIRIDDKNNKNFYGWFSVSSKDQKSTLRIKINMFGERTPFLPSADFANKGKEIELFSNKINENIYYSPATSEYSIISTFCLNKELKTEEPIPNYDINEANLNCSNDSYNLYDFNLLCEGGSVSGCEFLFNQILITFKLINN